MILKGFLPFTLSVLGTLWIPATSAGVYDLRGNAEIIVLSDPRVDFEVRNIVIRLARSSADFLTFSQLNDSVGGPFLESLNEIQRNRKIPVRGIYDLTASAVEGKGTGALQTRRVLSDSRLSCPGDVICAHPLDKVFSPLALSDYVHGKMLIIDKGTPREVIFIGGRNNTEHMLAALDSGFLIRPIDPSKPYLGTDMQTNYNELFSLLKSLTSNNVVNLKVPTPRNQPANEVARIIKTDRQSAEVGRILAILRKAPAADDVLEPFQFRPVSVQLRTNDLIKNLYSEDYRNGVVSRFEFRNDNHSHVAEEIEQFTGKIELSAYSYAPSKEIHDAFIGFVNRGNHLVIHTNGLASHHTVSPGGISFYYTVEALQSLFNATRKTTEKITVNLLDADRARDLGAAPFLHRKQILFVGTSRKISTPPRKFVINGSDNFTWSSSKKNDEFVIQIEDARMTDALAQVNQDELKIYKKNVAEVQIRKLYEARPMLYNCFRTLIKKIF